MALPNMAMIPSGYKPTKLYSVLPTETLGSELVTNGDFSNGSTDWTIEAVWTIADGVANGNGASGTSQELKQSVGLTSGKTYVVEYEIKNYVSGSVQTRRPPTSGKSGNGVYKQYATASSSSLLFKGNSFNGSITNISVKEVLVGNADFDVTRATPATRVNQQGLIETPEFIESGDLVTNGDFDTDSDWAKNPNWTISGGTANCDGTSDGTLFQTNVIEDNKEYSISYTISNLTQGKINISLSGTDGVKQDSNGTYTEVIKSGTSPSGRLSIECSSSPICSIDNVSVIQVERHNIPRLDYTDGTCPVLLTEPESTNLVIYSNDFSKWAKLQSLSTVTLNSIISPDGTVNGVKLTQIVASSNARLRLNPVVVVGKKYTFSIYAKKGNHDKLVMNISGINTTFTLTDDWARYEITETATNTFVDAGVTQGVVNDFIYMYGAQVEELDYSTSYIPTFDATFTRNQDIVNNAGTSATYNSVEGVLFVDVAVLVNQVVNKRITISDGTDANRILINISADQISGFVNVNSATQYTFFEGSQSVLNLNKIAIKYKQNDFAVWINGVQYDVSTSGTTFPLNTLTTLSFDNGSTAEFFFGKTSQVQVFNTALSDFDLLNLTSNATSYASYETMRTSLNFNIQ